MVPMHQSAFPDSGGHAVVMLKGVFAVGNTYSNFQERWDMSVRKLLSKGSGGKKRKKKTDSLYYSYNFSLSLKLVQKKNNLAGKTIASM